MPKKESEIYCTSYCNRGHRMSDGAPVGHECFVLPPASLKAEMDDRIAEAIEIIEAASPLKVHSGVKV